MRSYDAVMSHEARFAKLGLQLPARSIGTSSLPANIAVEIEMIVGVATR